MSSSEGRVRLVDRRRTIVRQPGLVREQVAQRDERRVARRIDQARQFGQVLLCGLVERQFAGVAELQDGQGREALRDGSETEDGVRIDGHLRLEVTNAVALRPDQLAVDHQAHREAGEHRLLRGLREVRVEPRHDGKELLLAPRIGERRERRRGLGEARRHRRRRCRSRNRGRRGLRGRRRDLRRRRDARGEEERDDQRGSAHGLAVYSVVDDADESCTRRERSSLPRTSRLTSRIVF
jgi:hypothetical protein